MFCEAISSVVIGIQGMLIRVEADVSSGAERLLESVG